MDYNLMINIDKDSLQKLHDHSFNLYIFKGSIADTGMGEPLVWQRYNYTDYEDSSELGWNEVFSAFISTEKIAENVTFYSKTAKTISFSQKMLVDQNGNVSVNSNGQPGCIEIQSKNPKVDYTCGICQQDLNGKMLPMCAFPLVTNTEDTIIPIEKIALYFATETIDTGSVKEFAKGNGIVIDLTDLKTRTVEFSFGDGWRTTDSGTLGKTFEPDAKLSSLLITVKSTAEIKKLAQDRIARKI